MNEEPEGGPKGPLKEPRDLRIRAQAKVEQDPITREGLLAEARQIGNWLNSSKRRVPTDRSLLNPIERRHLSARIHEEIDEHGNQCAVYLLALMYLTGLEIVPILESKISGDGILGDGFYRREIFRPPDGYEPPEGAAGAWQRPPDHVDLPLPALIGNLFPRSIGSQSPTLGQALGLNKSTAEDLIGEELRVLRENGHFPGMHRQRIPAQLGAVLSAYERDPAIVFHLAGGANPPSLIYYDAIPVTALVSAYERATARMLPAP